MRLMTIFYLATRNESELRVLFREVSGALVRTDRGSAERRNALASLENIATAPAGRALVADILGTEESSKEDQQDNR
jgi:hypothetical protein